jgi:hypothetical protein
VGRTLDDARGVAARTAEELMADGARAVVLVGSVAHGRARPTSDVDLVALGAGPADRLVHRDGWQVSVSWRTPDEVRARWHRPAEAGAAVRAWRTAVILADPAGEALRLRAEAAGWDWSLIAPAADRWVAEQVTGYAEEVQRLVGQAADGSPRAAAVMRSLLAVHLATVLAVHHRILYDSENHLWDLVSDREGPQWTIAQDRALGVVPVSSPTAMRAALDLYALTADRTAHLLDAEQAAVVNHALDLQRGAGP